MTAIELLHMIEASGARLTLTPSGRLRITGDHVERHFPIIAQYEAQLIDALQADARKQEGEQ